MKYLIATIILVVIIIQPIFAQLKEDLSPYERGTDGIFESKAYNMCYVGVPIMVAGLIVKKQDDSFRALRDFYLPEFDCHVDDYLQYSPAALMLGLKAAGVESRSSWGRMLTADAFSSAFMTIAVNSLKYTTDVMRPDGSSRNSFPSGHTATAFMTATMLHKEYGVVSPWYSIGGYSIATATGFMRMSNNKHWLSDVMVGASIGILTTELGYFISDLIFKDRGINKDLVAQKPSWFDYERTTSLGISLGIGSTIGNFDLSDGKELQVDAGSRVGFEGNHLFNQNIGIGGRLVATTSKLRIDDEPIEETLSVISYGLGPYFAYPLTPRWRVGAKALMQYNVYHDCQVEGYDIDVMDGGYFGVATGASVEFLSNAHWALKFFADYDLTLLRGLPHTNSHQQIVVGVNGNVLF